ncbi:MAG TPA: Hsp20 family protein [Rhizomicrobium sp.]|jgi:HSP20 family molecular chaperone IbpA|nr:Hsp20 family protein [Rhizomicrobium sp.]
MNKNTYFSSPFLLGFDHLERLLERTAKTANDGYPPYNIEETNSGNIRITLAVAGFNRDELAVTLEDSQLVIRGRQTESTGRTFLHRGIAARQFQRAFVLADGIEVKGAELENGLLSIELERPKPQNTARKIDIRNGSASREGRAEGGRK